jgi:hypothetical protein
MAARLSALRASRGARSWYTRINPKRKLRNVSWFEIVVHYFILLGLYLYITENFKDVLLNDFGT